MTTPQPAPAQQQQQPAGAEAQAAAQAAVILVNAVTAAQATAALYPLLAELDVAHDVLMVAFQTVMGFPPDRQGATGSATLQMIQQNWLRRGQFLISAAKRLQGDYREAKASGTSVADALRAGAARERRYYAQHLQASWNRMRAASVVDSAAGQYGDLLGWNTVLDTHTSAECRAANGKNFLASGMPLIGYPGMVHPHCRCYPGKPKPGAAMLPSGRALRAGIAA